LFDVWERRNNKTKPSLVYCGDDRKAKNVAIDLISDIGFEPVDAGGLAVARYTEPFALLVAELAYNGESGPELAYRFERFEKR
jgi:predicted dinucleotide-binding enzyme